MEFKLFDIINVIYFKEKKSFPIDTNICISLIKWLSFDSKNLSMLSKSLNYLWYITPQHFYYLLFCTIPKSSRVPRLVKPEMLKLSKLNSIYQKIQSFFNWSDRELTQVIPILDKVIDQKYWKNILCLLIFMTPTGFPGCTLI